MILCFFYIRWEYNLVLQYPYKCKIIRRHDRPIHQSTCISLAPPLFVLLPLRDRKYCMLRVKFTQREKSLLKQIASQFDVSYLDNKTSTGQRNLQEFRWASRVFFTIRFTNRQITALICFAITKTIPKIAGKWDC